MQNKIVSLGIWIEKELKWKTKRKKVINDIKKMAKEGQMVYI